MCGIAGFIDSTCTSGREDLILHASHMSDQIVHRGPDNGGIWIDEVNGVALAHRRLAIVDLSETGYQPMHSPSERYAITYNGEIYNFLGIKNTLEGKGHQFIGTSDTEVLLHAIEEWGLSQTLQKINGMFAFALWDKKDRTLTLARDRMGKKPLYYGWIGNAFVFASELKAIKAYPGFSAEIDRNVLSLYLRHNYVPSPWCIYKGVSKLPQSSYITIDASSQKEIHREKYWDILRVAQEGNSNTQVLSFDEALAKFEVIFDKAVVERMISDVPLGCFLSGGIDSSLVTAFMQKHSVNPVKTFCIGFEENGFNEAEYAKEIATHLGTEHTEYFVTSKEAQDVIPDIPRIFDEPFADPSQIPTYCVSRLARQHVTVALSGDGGDESFAGYARYHYANRYMNLSRAIPSPLGKIIGATLAHMPINDGRKHRILELLQRDEKAFYKLIMSYWVKPSEVVLSGQEPQFALGYDKDMPELRTFFDTMMYIDMVTYLPDDILTKVDRASMAASLETRAPLLDYEVVEFAWNTPLAMKIDDNGGKRLLKSILGQYVPAHLYERPKQGFGIPHGDWIKGPLRDWSEALLDPQRLEEEGFFNSRLVRQKWEEHISGRKDWSYALWGVLMFQAWHEYNASGN